MYSKVCGMFGVDMIWYMDFLFKIVFGRDIRVNFDFYSINYFF